MSSAPWPIMGSLLFPFLFSSLSLSLSLLLSLLSPSFFSYPRAHSSSPSSDASAPLREVQIGIKEEREEEKKRETPIFFIFIFFNLFFFKFFLFKISHPISSFLSPLFF